MGLVFWFRLIHKTIIIIIIIIILIFNNTIIHKTKPQAHRLNLSDVLHSIGNKMLAVGFKRSDVAPWWNSQATARITEELWRCLTYFTAFTAFTDLLVEGHAYNAF